ncbi:MAG: valine--tRNA ligase [Nitrospirota bacterium]|nr:MAG: valine--tRNA ligase [Nitrospirota bacterium]
MKEIDKHFEPEKVEDKWYTFWEKEGYFKPSDEGEPFCIVIPPPNVTGSLHMGHALNATLQDILTRWKRMSGYSALWLPGTDHAGIATQNVVEKKLHGDGLNRHELGREKFIEKVWEWKEQYGETIINQLKKIGASCDWSRQRFTLDDGLSSAVREVFVKLFEEELIYRDSRLINWCPRCHTALSDLEVEHEDLDGSLTYIKYPIEESNKHMIVATTRPETMLGDSAVAVNPDDSRYSGLIGKYIDLPLTGRKIPIIADEEVDPEFGTGAVKVTPAHDFNDEAIAKRQNPVLPFIKVISEDGKMTQEAGEKYKGMDRYDSRKAVVKDLKEQGLISKVDKYRHSVGHCYRCKTIIEPLSTIQWYVDVQGMAEEALDSVKRDNIRIHPESWKNSYYSWMENINDWCISRQIWWGHQIPVWYCPYCRTDEGILQGEMIHHVFFEPLSVDGDEVRGGTYAELKLMGFSHEEILNNSRMIRIDGTVKPLCSREDIHECPECSYSDIIRDPDVLDTWFSSSLWPFSTLGWPGSTEDLQKFYPTSVLVTAFDILFFWVARMIMMGLKIRKDVPFKDVYIHALVRDTDGKKMSKSKGNVIDPVIMIDKYGTDAFRFTLAAFAAQGRDIKFSEDRVEGYRHFVNKLWNASRFIMMNMQDGSVGDHIELEKVGLSERWILSRLSDTADDINSALNEYRFNDAANAIYQFIWKEFCDWYIEISKSALNGDDEIERKNTIACLTYVLESSLRLLHPFMPFVTEEIWQKLPHAGNSIMIENYPSDLPKDLDAEELMAKVMDVVSSIRSIRGELNISPSAELEAYIKTNGDNVREILVMNETVIKKLARLSSIEIGSDVDKPKGSASAVTPDMELFVPIKGVLDISEEIGRLKKELKKVKETISFLDKKLLNEDFLNNAPPEIVEKEKGRYSEQIEKKEIIEENIDKLKALESGV